MAAYVHTHIHTSNMHTHSHAIYEHIHTQAHFCTHLCIYMTEKEQTNTSQTYIQTFTQLKMFDNLRQNNLKFDSKFSIILIIFYVE